ncbi:MAG: hypothetical protein FWPMV1_gp5 [Hangzhou whitmania pigra medionivirus 1]|nr:MAG: hypothetical protein FWPMV1_gp5 [Hangzhou whitmania pigra medionivirus 1]
MNDSWESDDNFWIMSEEQQQSSSLSNVSADNQQRSYKKRNNNNNSSNSPSNSNDFSRKSFQRQSNSPSMEETGLLSGMQKGLAKVENFVNKAQSKWDSKFNKDKNSNESQNQVRRPGNLVKVPDGMVAIFVPKNESCDPGDFRSMHDSFRPNNNVVQTDNRELGIPASRRVKPFLNLKLDGLGAEDDPNLVCASYLRHKNIEYEIQVYAYKLDSRPSKPTTFYNKDHPIKNFSDYLHLPINCTSVDAPIRYAVKKTIPSGASRYVNHTKKLSMIVQSTGKNYIDQVGEPPALLESIANCTYSLFNEPVLLGLLVLDDDCYDWLADVGRRISDVYFDKNVSILDTTTKVKFFDNPDSITYSIPADVTNRYDARGRAVSLPPPVPEPSLSQKIKNALGRGFGDYLNTSGVNSRNNSVPNINSKSAHASVNASNNALNVSNSALVEHTDLSVTAAYDAIGYLRVDSNDDVVRANCVYVLGGKKDALVPGVATVAHIDCSGMQAVFFNATKQPIVVELGDAAMRDINNDFSFYPIKIAGITPLRIRAMAAGYGTIGSFIAPMFSGRVISAASFVPNAFAFTECWKGRSGSPFIQDGFVTGLVAGTLKKDEYYMKTVVLTYAYDNLISYDFKRQDVGEITPTSNDLCYLNLRFILIFSLFAIISAIICPKFDFSKDVIHVKDNCIPIDALILHNGSIIYFNFTDNFQCLITNCSKLVPSDFDFSLSFSCSFGLSSCSCSNWNDELLTLLHIKFNNIKRFSRAVSDPYFIHGIANRSSHTCYNYALRPFIINTTVSGFDKCASFCATYYPYSTRFMINGSSCYCFSLTSTINAPLANNCFYSCLDSSCFYCFNSTKPPPNSCLMFDGVNSNSCPIPQCAPATGSSVATFDWNIYNVSYIGCFNDSPASSTIRDISIYVGGVPNVRRCLELCLSIDINYKYIGMQYGAYCFCGFSYGNYGAALQSSCGMLCSDNLYCGGPRINAVYRLTDISFYHRDNYVSIYYPIFVGCIVDPPRSGFIYENNTLLTNDSVACIKFCADKYPNITYIFLVLYRCSCVLSTSGLDMYSILLRIPQDYCKYTVTDYRGYTLSPSGGSSYLSVFSYLPYKLYYRGCYNNFNFSADSYFSSSYPGSSSSSVIVYGSPNVISCALTISYYSRTEEYFGYSDGSNCFRFSGIASFGVLIGLQKYKAPESACSYTCSSLNCGGVGTFALYYYYYYNIPTTPRATFPTTTTIRTTTTARKVATVLPTISTIYTTTFKPSITNSLLYSPPSSLLSSTSSYNTSILSASLYSSFTPTITSIYSNSTSIHSTFMFNSTSTISSSRDFPTSATRTSSSFYISNSSSIFSSFSLTSSSFTTEFPPASIIVSLNPSKNITFTYETPPLLINNSDLFNFQGVEFFGRNVQFSLGYGFKESIGVSSDRYILEIFDASMFMSCNDSGYTGNSLLVVYNGTVVDDLGNRFVCNDIIYNVTGSSPPCPPSCSLDDVSISIYTGGHSYPCRFVMMHIVSVFECDMIDYFDSPTFVRYFGSELEIPILSNIIPRLGEMYPPASKYSWSNCSSSPSPIDYPIFIINSGSRCFNFLVYVYGHNDSNRGYVEYGSGITLSMINGTEYVSLKDDIHNSYRVLSKSNTCLPFKPTLYYCPDPSYYTLTILGDGKILFDNHYPGSNFTVRIRRSVGLPEVHNCYSPCIIDPTEAGEYSITIKIGNNGTERYVKYIRNDCYHISSYYSLENIACNYPLAWKITLIIFACFIAIFILVIGALIYIIATGTKIACCGWILCKCFKNCGKHTTVYYPVPTSENVKSVPASFSAISLLFLICCLPVSYTTTLDVLTIDNRINAIFNMDTYTGSDFTGAFTVKGNTLPISGVILDTYCSYNYVIAYWFSDSIATHTYQTTCCGDDSCIPPQLPNRSKYSFRFANVYKCLWSYAKCFCCDTAPGNVACLQVTEESTNDWQKENYGIALEILESFPRVKVEFTVGLESFEVEINDEIGAQVAFQYGMAYVDPVSLNCLPAGKYVIFKNNMYRLEYPAYATSPKGLIGDVAGIGLTPGYFAQRLEFFRPADHEYPRYYIINSGFTAFSDSVKSQSYLPVGVMREHNCQLNLSYVGLNVSMNSWNCYGGNVKGKLVYSESGFPDISSYGIDDVSFSFENPQCFACDFQFLIYIYLKANKKGRAPIICQGVRCALSAVSFSIGVTNVSFGASIYNSRGEYCIQVSSFKRCNSYSASSPRTYVNLDGKWINGTGTDNSVFQPFDFFGNLWNTLNSYSWMKYVWIALGILFLVFCALIAFKLYKSCCPNIFRTARSVPTSRGKKKTVSFADREIEKRRLISNADC